MPLGISHQRVYLTDMRFCCAANVVTASEARDPDAYRDCSNRLLDCPGWRSGTKKRIMAGWH